MQWLYVAYRWILALFFLSYVIQSLVSNGGYYFIYLTLWSLTLYTAYLLWSASSITVRFVQEHIRPVLCIKREVKQADDGCRCSSCCYKDGDTTTWYMKIQWLLFYIGIEGACIVTLLFWTLLYPGCRGTDSCESHENYIVHLVNGLTAFLEVWITGIPIHLYHVIYSMMFGSTYAVFTGLYFAGNGTNNIDGGNYIYTVLNYEKSPSTAAVTVILPVILLLPLLHLFLFANYLARKGLLYLIKRHLKCYNTEQQSI